MSRFAALLQRLVFGPSASAGFSMLTADKARNRAGNMRLCKTVYVNMVLSFSELCGVG